MGAKVKDLWSLRSSKNLRLSHICEFLKYMEGRSATEYEHLYHEAARIKRLKVQHTEGRGVSDAAVEAVMKAYVHTVNHDIHRHKQHD